MRKNLDTTEDVLKAFDECISDRDRRLDSLNNQFKTQDNHILKQDYDEYSYRKKDILKRFHDEAIAYQLDLDRLCKLIRKSQPSLLELSEKNINLRGRFPRNIALGKLHVICENLDFYVPKSFPFPFEQPMYICDENKVVLLHKVLLRLLFALPIDKQQYFIFDPIGLGKTVSKFNSIFDLEPLFPQKKVMTTAAELKPVLKETMSYILDLQSNVFNLETDCQDWDTYNRRLHSQGNIKKVLPYKIFIFTSVPDVMDQECFDMFRTLIKHSKQCGIMVLFSFNEAVLNTEDTKMKKTEIELKSCIKNSEKLHVVFENECDYSNYKNLKIKNVGEKFPDDLLLNRMLIEIKKVANHHMNRNIDFSEVVNLDSVFDKKSIDGLEFPVGYGASGNSIITLKVDDETPHYLIGGTTGSGKSNLLHNIILSACCRYSPDELHLYLLDFKEGVEFSQYASPVLKHASLIATEADTEYGITVLKHLIEEKENRYSLFKRYGCKDIQGYRKMNSVDIMPRILVVIDEFQILFGNAQKDQTIANLEMLAKQGRACGIHLILATQSLKGIDFSTLGPQFSGRIALKCSAEDSKILLGGITSNNEEASGLKIPYAILNTSQGSISGNIKFAVAKAEESSIKLYLKAIDSECYRKNYHNITNIFDGQVMPVRPDRPVLSDMNYYQLHLGEYMDYCANPFLIKFNSRPSENLLVCGHNDCIKKSLLNSIVISTLVNTVNQKEIIYIGDYFDYINSEISNSVCLYNSMRAFIETIQDNPYEKKRIIIVDNCNLNREIGYSPTMYINSQTDKAAVFFKNYIDELNEHGSHIIAFYEGMNRIKNSGIPKDEFCYRIGYDINVDEKNFLLGAGSQSTATVKKNRAFFVDNLELKAWFRPFRK